MSDRGDNLSLLYQGIITAVVRIRSGDRPMGEIPSFRKGILDMKAEVEQEAFRLKYERRHVEDATSAVVAYVDESVFTSNDPNRNQWPALQAELFGRAVGGEDFFKRLDDLNRQPNSSQLADVLEVYLLCLLLGYQGRYRVAPSELRRTTVDLEARIELIRGVDERFSPDGLLPDGEPVQLIAGDKAAAWLRRVFLALLPIVVGVWVFIKIGLNSRANDLVRSLRQG